RAGNFTYDVRDTPCEFVARDADKKELIAYPSNVASLFPKDVWLKDNHVESYIGIPLFNLAGGYLGHMVVMDGKPFENVEVASSILRIFASRAAGEMERKQIEDNLLNAMAATDAANKAKGDFLSSMSHEIRTPMNAIIGLSQLCLQTDLTARQLDYLQKIQGASKSLLGIINDVLDISKIEAGKLELEEAPFYLDSVMENLATISCVKAQEKSLECSLEISPDVPDQLIGDPLRLGQVLINLTGNAVKFTEKGEITIRVETEEATNECATLRFTVQDTGIGLTQEQIGKLFQSFTQADTSTSRKFGGTGLGLSISKRLVELMKGKIWVESIPFTGSKFIFTAQFRKPPLQAGKSYTQESSLCGLRTLVVESNATSLGIIQSLLHSFAFEVTAVGDAAAALKAIQNAEMQGAPYHLVVASWKMPGTDGIKMAQKIRSTEGLGSTPKILLLGTYCPDSPMLHASVERGVIDGILSKPVLKKGLFDAIMEIFDHASTHEKRSAPAGLFDSSHAAAISGAHLLLVEDNEINQQIAQELLEKAGVTVTIAENGEVALTCLLEENFDGVLMDTQMPVMDGLTATRELRKNPKFEKLPVIAITANALANDLDECLGAGMNDFIIKPLDSYKMMATLARWIIPSRRVALPAGQPQHAEPLPDLPGINVTKGISRVGGSVTSYYAILEKFCTGQRHTAASIREALDADDWKKAERLAHTLKGLAGTIGAERLQVKATELEKYIHELGLTQINMLLPVIEADLSSLIAILENALLSRMEEASAAIPDGVAPTHHEGLAELIRKLRTQLKEFDSGADESIARIRKITGNDPALRDTLASVQQCINNYDYEQALIQLAALASSLDFPFNS
ncbi:MAG: response regulator, partial [Gallionellaceae bacterium]|nr:response regulator [Gallionellaceae bacterium]